MSTPWGQCGWDLQVKTSDLGHTYATQHALRAEAPSPSWKACSTWGQRAIVSAPQKVMCHTMRCNIPSSCCYHKQSLATRPSPNHHPHNLIHPPHTHTISSTPHTPSPTSCKPSTGCSHHATILYHSPLTLCIARERERE